MTIDEGIEKLEYGIEQLEMEIESGLWIKGSESELSCKEGIVLNKQYIEWLKELKEAKRLLKLAVEDFKEINSDILTCKYCKWYSAETGECSYYNDDVPCEQICGWKYEGEALKLIGGSENE